MVSFSLYLSGQKKNPVIRQGTEKERTSLIFRLTAGFGTLYTQVAGLHRAVPSTTLDKVFNCYGASISAFFDMSRKSVQTREKLF